MARSGSIPWSDDRRRLFCRSAFFLLAVLPTLATACLLCQPADPAAFLAGFCTSTGCTATAARIETPQPGRTLLRQLAIEAGGGPALHVPAVAVSGTSPVRIGIAETIRLPAAGIARLLQQFCQPPQESPASEPAPLFHLRCERIILTAGDGPDLRHLIVAPLEAATVRDGLRVLTTIRFGIPGGDSQPVELVIEQSREPGAPRQLVRLDTGRNLLPAWLFEAAVPELTRLGMDAAWTGVVRLSCGEAGSWNADARGQLHRVDLQAVCADTALPVSGKAVVTVDSFSMAKGRIVRLLATVCASGGRIGPDPGGLLERFGWSIRSPAPRAGTASQFASGGTGNEPAQGGIGNQLAQGETGFAHLVFRLECADGEVALLPLPDYIAADGVPWIGWDEAGQPAVQGRPHVAPRPLLELAAGLFPAASGGEPSLDNRAVAFLSRFQLRADPAIPTAVPTADPVTRIATRPDTTATRR